MAEHAGEKEPGAKDADLDAELVRELRVRERPGHDAKSRRQHREESVAQVPALAVEAEDEGEEIDRERHDPQQRHGGDVLRDVVGHREEQERARGGERAPECLAGDGRRRLGVAFAVASP